MSATVGDAPDPGPLLVDAGKSFSKGERVPIVFYLVPWIEMLPRLARAFAKPAIIKTQSSAT